MMAVRKRRRFGCAGLGLSQMRICQTHAKGCVSFTASWVARIFPAVVAYGGQEKTPLQEKIQYLTPLVFRKSIS